MIFFLHIIRNGLYNCRKVIRWIDTVPVYLHENMKKRGVNGRAFLKLQNLIGSVKQQHINLIVDSQQKALKNTGNYESKSSKKHEFGTT